MSTTRSGPVGSRKWTTRSSSATTITSGRSSCRGSGSQVEIHLRPMLPDQAEAPLAEIFEAAVPSSLAIDGISAPRAEHHALMLAAHAWGHEPLGSVARPDRRRGGRRRSQTRPSSRDPRERWGMDQIWRTTAASSAALLDGGRTPMALRVFGRHLATVRERTVLENHRSALAALRSGSCPSGRRCSAPAEYSDRSCCPTPANPGGTSSSASGARLLHPSRSMTEHTEGWRGGARERQGRQSSRDGAAACRQPRRRRLQ